MPKLDHRKIAQAYLNREAAVSDWIQWMAQPASKIVEHHKEFVFGPVRDLIDNAIKAMAPVLVKQLAEAEIKADLEDFQRGAIAGKADRESGRGGLNRGESEDFIEGYQWGFEQRTDKISPQMRKSLVEEALTEFRSRVSVQVVVSLLKKIWHGVNPLNTVRAMIAAVKKYGWKLGVGFALFEIFEHFVLPSVLTYLFDDPRLMAFATLPIGEVVYAVALRALGRAPKELNNLTKDGHLDWYENQFGPVRIACLRS